MDKKAVETDKRNDQPSRKTVDRFLYFTLHHITRIVSELCDAQAHCFNARIQAADVADIDCRRLALYIETHDNKILSVQFSKELLEQIVCILWAANRPILVQQLDSFNKRNDTMSTRFAGTCFGTCPSSFTTDHASCSVFKPYVFFIYNPSNRNSPTSVKGSKALRLISGL
ncbi:hypothetical protein SporoS204_12480 [Sporosarcina ureae]|uniref:Uncharacterized protein n=1 Tax=Sporosarcina ureae TaxID=1571 RepID=A0ABM6JXM3_SPOUR|nr:hypothetical protein SporoS204_12480 [Sporosarcina ureae]